MENETGISIAIACIAIGILIGHTIWNNNEEQNEIPLCLQIISFSPNQNQYVNVNLTELIANRSKNSLTLTDDVNNNNKKTNKNTRE